VQFGDGTRWWRRYTEYFPKRSGQALAIATEALRERDNWQKMVESWTGEIADSPAYPDWLKQGGLNELYYSVFGSFWENGCITKKKKFGARPGQHLEYVWRVWNTAMPRRSMYGTTIAAPTATFGPGSSATS
jgi:uncharacterized protein (DUF608 family)